MFRGQGSGREAGAEAVAGKKQKRVQCRKDTGKINMGTASQSRMSLTTDGCKVAQENIILHLSCFLDVFPRHLLDATVGPETRGLMHFSPDFDDILFRKLLSGSSKSGLLCKEECPGAESESKAGMA